MATREEWARWLEKDGEHKLFAVNELDDARKDGWKEPETVRGNGLPWNPEYHEGEGEPQSASLAKAEEGRKAVDDKRLAREAKRIEADAKAAEAARADAAKTPDLKVEVVEPAKKQVKR